jgi:hypothetical protein
MVQYKIHSLKLTVCCALLSSQAEDEGDHKAERTPVLDHPVARCKHFKRGSAVFYLRLYRRHNKATKDRLKLRQI